MQITIDVETDWGGRSSDLQGIKEGIPFILEALKKYHLKAIFFLNTQYLHRYITLARTIVKEGHTIGNHGFLHIRWKNNQLAWHDRTQSEILLRNTFNIETPIPYRAPWFSATFGYDDYDNLKNHTSVLKHTWFGGKVGSIIYVHPFDLVKPSSKAPTLFLKILYSRSSDCRERFLQFLDHASSHRS